jgi:hypothetical protein
MGFLLNKEKRSSKDRRSGRDRRQNDDVDYEGPQRRRFLERRMQEERRRVDFRLMLMPEL